MAGIPPDCCQAEFLQSKLPWYRHARHFWVDSKKKNSNLRTVMLIRILPSNMMAAQPEYVAQPHFMPGEILINGTCVRSPPRRPLRPRPVRLRTGPVRVDARARAGAPARPP